MRIGYRATAFAVALAAGCCAAQAAPSTFVPPGGFIMPARSFGEKGVRFTVAQVAGVETLFITVTYDGLYLDQGSTLAVNDQRVTMPFDICTEDGCIAQTPLTDAVKELFKTHTRHRILVTKLDRQVAEIDFSPEDFAQVYRRYQAQGAPGTDPETTPAPTLFLLAPYAAP